MIDQAPQGACWPSVPSGIEPENVDLDDAGEACTCLQAFPAGPVDVCVALDEAAGLPPAGEP